MQQEARSPPLKDLKQKQPPERNVTFVLTNLLAIVTMLGGVLLSAITENPLFLAFAVAFAVGSASVSSILVALLREYIPRPRARRA